MKLLAKTLIAAVFAASALGVSAQARHVIKVGHGAQAGHPSHLAAVRFGEILAQKTNGQVKVEVYPDRQLGEERELVEGLQLGSIDMAVVSTGPITSFVPQVGVLDLPFVFKDSPHVYRVLDGKVGQELLGAMAAKNIIGLAWWENGWRHLTSKKLIATPKDLQGMKLRTMQNPVHIEAFKRLGASPIPMAWGEVFTSLSQGVIDGQENPITVIYTNSLWEVQKNVTLTGHVYGPHAVMMSRTTWTKLPADIQSAVKAAVVEATGYQRAQSAKLEGEQITLLKQRGMTVTAVDTTPFRQATAEVATSLKNIDPKLLAAIRADAN
jgi:TRAP-type transport system periplasmic protein